MVMVGPDKGKVGEVLTIIKERNWVFVKDLNLIHEHTFLRKGFPKSLNHQEGPLLAPTQVKLVDPEDNEPTTVEWRITEDGHRVRVSQRTGRIIPFPMGYLKLDPVVNRTYTRNVAKDTQDSEVKERTYKPVLKTFEQDIMDEMGIKDERKRKPTYWY